MKDYSEFEVGQYAERTVLVTADQIAAFAEVSGDRNPIHLDSEYASKTIFGDIIAHGMLAVSFISATLGNDLPGEGTIFLSQDLRFSRPAYVGDELTVRVEITSLRPEKRHIELATTCRNQKGVAVLEGKALVKYLEP